MGLTPRVIGTPTGRVAVVVAVHHRVAPSRADRSGALVQLEPIRTAQHRAANAVGSVCRNATWRQQPETTAARQSSGPTNWVRRASEASQHVRLMTPYCA